MYEFPYIIFFRTILERRHLIWFSKKIVSSFSPEEMQILKTRLNEGQTWLLLASEEELRQELSVENKRRAADIEIDKTTLGKMSDEAIKKIKSEDYSPLIKEGVMLEAIFHSTYSNGKVEKSFKGQVPCIPSPGTYIRVPDNIRCNSRTRTMPVTHSTIDSETGILEVYLNNGSLGYSMFE